MSGSQDIIGHRHQGGKIKPRENSKRVKQRDKVRWVNGEVRGRMGGGGELTTQDTKKTSREMFMSS